MVNEITTAFTPISFMALGPIDTNVYIVDDGGGCFVVDPADELEAILEAVGGRRIDAIVVTHGHWDHTGALAALHEATGAPVICGTVEAPYLSGEKDFTGHAHRSDPCPVARTVDEGELLQIGNTAWRVIATPGHTPGGICLMSQPAEDQPGLPVLIAGDTLFAGSHGRVDFDEGNIDDMRQSLVKLAALPPETIVLPGHNSLTTIARESGWLRICCV